MLGTGQLLHWPLLEKDAAVPIMWEYVWAPELTLMLWGKGKFCCPIRNWTTVPRSPSQPQKLNGRLTLPIICDWIICSVLELQITWIFPVHLQRHIYICIFSRPKRYGLGGSGAWGGCSSASDLSKGGECRVMNADYFRIFRLWNRKCILILWIILF